MMRNQIVQNFPNKIHNKIKIAALALSLLFSGCENSISPETTKEKDKIGFEDSCKKYEDIANKARKEQNHTVSIPNYLQALHYNKALGNRKKEQIISKNIAMAYYQQKNYDKFLEYITQALAVAEEIDYEYGIRFANLALWDYEYDIKNNPDAALAKYRPLRENIESMADEGDKKEMKMKYANAIANCYMKKWSHKEAEIYRNQAMSMNSEIKDTITDINILYNKGALAYKQKKYPEAEEKLLEWLRLSQEKNKQTKIKEHELLLAELYAEIGDRKQAYKYREKAAAINEKIINETTAKTQQEMETKLQTAEKQQQIDKQQTKIEIQSERQKKMIYGYVWALLLLLWAGTVAGTYRVQKNKISRKNKEIETINEEIKIINEKLEDSNRDIQKKNKDTLSSIQYAKNIQEIILPTTKKIKELFPESFILCEPKDIVSGDFYRLDKTKNGKKLFAAVDCTGHGVPWALLSVMWVNILSNAVESWLENPWEILDYLSKSFYEKTHEKDNQTTFNDMIDSMDIALCSYDETTQTLEYAGAFNPIYISYKNEFKELSPDRIPIGIGGMMRWEKYETKKNKVEKWSIVYLFSDGYADQYSEKKIDGVINRKKMTRRRFKAEIQKISKLPMERQKQKLKEYFDDRKGSSIQIDDVLVMGIKV